MALKECWKSEDIPASGKQNDVQGTGSAKVVHQDVAQLRSRVSGDWGKCWGIKAVPGNT